MVQVLRSTRVYQHDNDWHRKQVPVTKLLARAQETGTATQGGINARTGGQSILGLEEWSGYDGGDLGRGRFPRAPEVGETSLV